MFGLTKLAANFRGIDLSLLNRREFASFIKKNPEYLQHIGIDLASHTEPLGLRSQLYSLLVRRGEHRMIPLEEFNNKEFQKKIVSQYPTYTDDMNETLMYRLLKKRFDDPYDVGSEFNPNLNNLQNVMGKADGGWLHFYFDPSVLTEGRKRMRSGGNIPKSFITLKDLHQFTPEQAQQFLTELRGTGFTGAVKFPDSAKNIARRFDNIVIHGLSPQDVVLGTKQAKQTFGDNISSVQFGKDVGARTDTELLAKRLGASLDPESYKKYTLDEREMFFKETSDKLLGLTKLAKWNLNFF